MQNDFEISFVQLRYFKNWIKPLEFYNFHQTPSRVGQATGMLLDPVRKYPDEATQVPVLSQVPAENEQVPTPVPISES